MSIPFDGRFGLYGAYNGPETQRNPDSNCLQYVKTDVYLLSYTKLHSVRQDIMCKQQPW